MSMSLYNSFTMIKVPQIDVGNLSRNVFIFLGILQVCHAGVTFDGDDKNAVHRVLLSARRRMPEDGDSAAPFDPFKQYSPCISSGILSNAGHDMRREKMDGKPVSSGCYECARSGGWLCNPCYEEFKLTVSGLCSITNRGHKYYAARVECPGCMRDWQNAKKEKDNINSDKATWEDRVVAIGGPVLTISGLVILGDCLWKINHEALQNPSVVVVWVGLGLTLIGGLMCICALTRDSYCKDKFFGC